MSIQNDIEFLKRIKLDNFKEIEKNKFNFRCPICLDSKRSKRKARGYAFPHKSKDVLYVYCHNCSFNSSFYYFTKELLESGYITSSLYDNYLFRRGIKNETNEVLIIEEKTNNFVLKENKYLVNVNRFKNDSIVKRYLLSRRIDEKFFDDIYFSLNMKLLINNYYEKDKYENEFDLPRIVFPIFHGDKLIGFQGRCIYITEYRYLNFKIGPNEDFFYMQKDLDENKTVFVTEGIFDCLMLDNSISMLGSNLSEKILQKFKKVIFVYDNERRNDEIIHKYNKIIDRENIGLFIWPDELKYKDLNEWAVEKGKGYIENIILKNSYFKKIEKYFYFKRWLN